MKDERQISINDVAAKRVAVKQDEKGLVEDGDGIIADSLKVALSMINANVIRKQQFDDVPEDERAVCGLQRVQWFRAKAWGINIGMDWL